MSRPLSPDTLVYDFTPASDPQLAPDGARVVYTLSATDRESQQTSSQLWLCDVDGGNARRLTRAGERNGGARWSPDGAWLAFTSDRAGEKRSGIYVMPADAGGEAREVTTHRQAIAGLAWSPDGARLAYATLVDPENPGEDEPQEGAPPPVRVTSRLDYKQDNRGYLGDKRFQLFVVEVASGERRQLTNEPVDHNFPQWSPDGRRLAAQVSTHGGLGSRLALVDVASGETTFVGPEGGVVAQWAWSPSGDRVIFAGDTEQTWQTDYFVYTVATGDLRRLTDDLPVLPVAGFPTIAPPSQPVWLDDRQVLFHAVRAGGSGLYVIDAATGGVEPAQRWQALNVGMSVDNAKRHVAQGYASLDALGEVAVCDTRDDTLNVITHYSEPVLREHPPAQWERFDVRRGDFTIEAWLLKPPDFDPNKKYPLVLDVHGGPNGFYGYAFNAVQQLLATNGFVVVFSNPRGSSSYGRHFTTQVRRDWGGEDFQDLMAVVDAALERPYVDRERTGIFGYSYGGYMTSWTIGQTDRFKAAVCGAPCFDLESFFGTSDIGHSFGARQFGSAPHEDREWYLAHSPSNFAHRATTPTLIVH
ncbi:MAG TPA: S9 family peptidase, partial [Thermomicrobiales bacterium]|nr:S9 family peptidase [Thermomicrobiales bacterium]